MRKPKRRGHAYVQDMLDVVETKGKEAKEELSEEDEEDGETSNVEAVLPVVQRRIMGKLLQQAVAR